MYVFTFMGEVQKAYKILFGKSEGKRRVRYMLSNYKP
jgi:hypothetical protein